MREKFLPVFLILLAGCGSASAATEVTGGGSGGTTAVPDMYKSFGNGTTVTVEGTYVVIKSNGIPDHKSPYFGTGNAKYEAYNGTNPNYQSNGFTIVTQSFTFKVPLTPTALSSPSPTPLGPIGVATNGVPIFNQYAGNGQPLTNEINSFDQYAGHPQMTGVYHYHVEPKWLTRNSASALVGVLLDGYPVYGPVENGQVVTTASLDAAHGHFGATAEFPNGIYHYHTTSDAPYINGSGFHGAPGTVSQ